MAAPPDNLERLAYELSTGLLSRQEAVLDELRARTGTLIAVSALVASFLGAAAIRATGVTLLTVLALLAFFTSTLASVYVLLPKQSLVFGFRGTLLLEDPSRQYEQMAETYRRVTYWIESFHTANQEVIDRHVVLLRVAAVALMPEVSCWTLELLR